MKQKNKKIIIRHINLSGDTYSRLVYGEESSENEYYFQKYLYKEKNMFKRWLIKKSLLKENHIEPRFRKLRKSYRYIYIVSLWGDPEVRKAIITELRHMNRKRNNIKIVGYWADPAFDLAAYKGYRFDMLIQSVSEQVHKWPNVEYMHLPVASLGFDGEKQQVEYDCFSVGSFTELRLDKIINSERQFRKNGLRCYWCVAGMNPTEQQAEMVNEIKKYRKFPDVEGMSADETLRISSKANVMLNISRLTETYQTNPSYYAIIFNKKLLIDSEKIKDVEYYDSEHMKVVDFSNPKWLTEDLVSWMKKVEEINYGYHGEWEPEVFYSQIRDMVLKDWEL